MPFQIRSSHRISNCNATKDRVDRTIYSRWQLNRRHRHFKRFLHWHDMASSRPDVPSTNEELDASMRQEMNKQNIKVSYPYASDSGASWMYSCNLQKRQPSLSWLVRYLFLVSLSSEMLNSFPPSLNLSILPVLNPRLKSSPFMIKCLGAVRFPSGVFREWWSHLAVQKSQGVGVSGYYVELPIAIIHVNAGSYLFGPKSSSVMSTMLLLKCRRSCPILILVFAARCML